VAAGLPIITAGIGVGIGLFGIFVVAAFVVVLGTAACAGKGEGRPPAAG